MTTGSEAQMGLITASVPTKKAANLLLPESEMRRTEWRQVGVRMEVDNVVENPQKEVGDKEACGVYDVDKDMENRRQFH